MRLPEYKCTRCGRVHVALNAQQIADVPAADRPAISKCFACGAPASQFVPAGPDDAPKGCTLTPIILPTAETPASGVLPAWACCACGIKVGGPARSDVAWQSGTCGICGEAGTVTEFRNFRPAPIATANEHKAALREISPYFENEPALGSPESVRFEVLAQRIEDYEAVHFPLGHNFSEGQRGAVSRDNKKQRISIYLDSDVLAAVRAKAAAQGKGYQSLINKILREAVPEGKTLPRPSIALLRHFDRVEQLCTEHHAANPRVFGSVLTATDTIRSDLDLLVDPVPGTTLLTQGALHDALADLLGCPIDLVTPNGLPAGWRDRVLEEALPLADWARRQN